MKIGSSPNKMIPNAVIAGLLTLQLLPFFLYGWTFPFISYPMYSRASPPGSCLAPHSKVILHTRSGNKIHFLPQAGQELSRSVSIYGLSQTTYQRHYLSPMIFDRNSDASKALAQDLGRRINRVATDPVVKIELQVDLYQLSDAQIEETESYSDQYNIHDNE